MTVLPKILSVDDDDFNLKIMRDYYLRNIGAEIIDAHSGYEALELMQHHSFALLLLDVEMPGMNGLELASQIRLLTKGVQIPIIFVTAVHTQPQEIMAGYQYGAIDYLTKPLQLPILQAKVKGFLQLWTMTQELRERESWVRRLLNSTAEGIIGTDIDGRCSFANQQALSIIGTTMRQLKGADIHTIIHHSQGPQTHRASECPTFQRALQGETIHNEVDQIMTVQGDAIAAEFWLHPIFDPLSDDPTQQVVGVMLTFVDNEAHRRQEAQLQRQVAQELLENERLEGWAAMMETMTHQLSSQLTVTSQTASQIMELCNRIEQLGSADEGALKQLLTQLRAEACLVEEDLHHAINLVTSCRHR